MKAMVKTSVLVLTLAITGLLALSVAPALAAPDYSGGDQMQIDPELMAQFADVIAAGEEPEEYPVPPEEFPVDPCLVLDCEVPGDQPGGEGEVPGGEGEVPGDDPTLDGGDEPGQPEEQLTPETPEQPLEPRTPQPDDTPKAPVASSKLPNTGSGLLLIAAAGVLLIAAALGGGRLVRQRTR